ncbi:hypothetical protein ACFW2K_35525 [Streptomyces nigra]|uniref:hypothetical protein n=1 Tax=Streptomyces nigra TaxID=1827580 RepID=UPI0036C71467
MTITGLPIRKPIHIRPRTAIRTRPVVRPPGQTAHTTQPTIRTGPEIAAILQKIQLITINNIPAKGPDKTGEPTRQETGQARKIDILAIKTTRPAPVRTELHQRHLHRNRLQNLINRLGQRRRDMQRLQ